MMALGLLLLGLVISSMAEARPRVAVSGPTKVVGDGERTVRLTISVHPPRARLGADRVVLQATAGTLGEPHPAGKGRFEVEFVAPRVAEPLVVTIAPTGKRFDVEPLKITVEPPSGIGRPRRTGGPLDLTVPDHLVLGRVEAAPLSVQGPDADLHVSVGTIGAVEPEAGRLRAVYSPPQEKYPQVAIVVAATRDDGRVDWTTMALHGRPRVQMESAAHAWVRVQLAGMEFGPLRADAEGRAALRLEAPPGVDEAAAVAVAPHGARRNLTLPLRTPSAGHLMALCQRRPRRLLVFVVDDRGSPRSGVKLALQASGGQLGEARALEPGLYEAPFTPPPTTAADQRVTASARIEGEELRESRCTFDVPARAQAARLIASAEGAAILADGTSGTVIRVQAVDAQGQSVRQVELTAQARGKLGVFAAVAPGAWEATYAAPALDEPGRDEVVIRDELSGQQTQLTIELELPRPKRWLRASLRGGVLTNFGRVIAPVVAGAFEVRLPFADDNFTAGIEAGYYGSSSSDMDAAGLEEVAVSVRAVPIVARLGYEIPLGLFRPYLAAQGGALVATTEVSSPTSGTTRDTAPRFVGGGLLGADVSLGPGRVALEAGYGHADAGDGAVTGNLAGLGITGGYRYEF